MKGVIKEIIKAIGRVLGNKYLTLIALVVVVLMGLGGLQMHSCHSEENEKLQTYSRQLEGKLTAKEQELQQLDTELGVAHSKLVTQEELAKQLKKDKEELNTKFNKFVEKHNLQIKSKDRTIASLEQKLQGGNSGTNVTPGDTDPNTIDLCKSVDQCIISYFWTDPLQRFELRDPNIFEKGNETFKSKQFFKIYGEVWEQEDGSLQTRRLVLREMMPTEDGDYEPIPGAKAKVVDSEFTYHNPPTIEPEFQWTDMFRLRAIAVGGVEILPNSGHLTFGLGLEFFNLYGFGIGTFTSFDFQNPENIAQHISIEYNPTIFDTELNLGIFVSMGSPFARIFDDYQFSSGLIFYLNR